MDNEHFSFENYATFRIIMIDNYAYALRFVPKKRFGVPLEIPFVEGVDVENLYVFLLKNFPDGKFEEIS